MAEGAPRHLHASHMLILPLVDFYATACDWWVAGLRRPPPGLFWFLIVSYLNGIVIEIGRKTRAPADEEHGVETYSALWGTHGAVRAWLGAVALTAARRLAGVGAHRDTGRRRSSCWRAGGRVRDRRAAASSARATPGSGKSIELMSGVWTILMYVGLGAAPLAIARVAGSTG